MLYKEACDIAEGRVQVESRVFLVAVLEVLLWETDAMEDEEYYAVFMGLKPGLKP